MNKLFVALLLAVLIMGGGLAALTMRERDEALRKSEEASVRAEKADLEIKKLEVSLAKVTKERTEALAEATRAATEMKAMVKKVADAEARIAQATEAASGKGRRSIAESAAIGTPDKTKPMKAMAEMMKNPAMREMVKQQQLAQLDLQYGNLFNRFQLNDEEKANFKQLIAERMTSEMDMGLKFMEGNTSKPERDAALKVMTDSKAASDAKIKTFLNNDEDYKTFQDWEESKPERMQLSMGSSNFATAGEPLSPQQEDQLVAAMKQARTSVKNLPDMTKPQNADPTNFTPAMTDRLMTSYDQQAQQVLASASSFLTPKQLEALKALQQQQRAMQEAGLKMSSMMFGNGKK